jgi:NADH-quinone oxidoreductase subunit G
VFDTNFAADIFVMEAATQLADRVLQKKTNQLPMFTSVCSTWIDFVEKKFPRLEPHLFTGKSPQAIMSTLVRTFYARKIGANPEDLVIVSIVPCVPKKAEIRRPQLFYEYLKDGRIITALATDFALTTHEAYQLIDKVDFSSLKDQEFDKGLSMSTGAAALFATSGGTTEAILRTAYSFITGKDMMDINFPHIRISGSEIFREAEVDFEGTKINLAVISGIKNACEIVRNVLSGEKKYHLIEVTACTGGCIGPHSECCPATPEMLLKRFEAVRRMKNPLFHLLKK